jgi:hypothetical protein
MTRTTLEIDKITLQNLKQIGKKCETYDQIIKNRIKCNSSDCQAAGGIPIDLSIGSSRKVTLFVCPNCVGNFEK